MSLILRVSRFPVRPGCLVPRSSASLSPVPLPGVSRFPGAAGMSGPSGRPRASLVPAWPARRTYPLDMPRGGKSRRAGSGKRGLPRAPGARSPEGAPPWPSWVRVRRSPAGRACGTVMRRGSARRRALRRTDANVCRRRGVAAGGCRGWPWSWFVGRCRGAVADSPGARRLPSPGDRRAVRTYRPSWSEWLPLALSGVEC